MDKIQSKKRKKFNVFKISNKIVFLIATLIIYLILSTSIITKTYDLNVGDIAKVDIKAPKDIENQLATESEKEEAIKHVPDVYSYNGEVSQNAIKNIEEFFKDAIEVTGKYENVSAQDTKAEERKIGELKKVLKISNLSEENYQAIAKATVKELEELRSFTTNTMTKLFDEMKIHEDKPQDIVLAQGMITTIFNNSRFSKNLKDIGMNVGYSQVKPNYFIDYDKTQEQKEEAKKKVKPVIIKKDQIIVKEGEPVNQIQIEVLKELGLLDKDNSLRIYVYIALLVLILSVVIMQWHYLKNVRSDLYSENNKILVINTLTIISLILATTLNIISPYAIPFACVPILISILVDNRASVIINILNVILMSVIVKFNPIVIIIALFNAVAVPVMLKKVQQRNDILHVAAYLAVFNFIFALALGYILSNHIRGVIIQAGFTSLGSIISGILAIGILPVLENIFDIVTNIKLLELANPNSPLLKRLSLEAPGTYNHSVLVANLAELGAEEVGANSVLARVGAYYHDVGKIERAYYFKENQFSGENPHDRISPKVSSLIITSHVTDGVELAKKYGLPKIIRDVIEQHHGDSLVKYFYITMKNSSENPEEVKEEDFKYKGIKPLSKEVAIIMLADSTEAAVRSIQNPTKEKIESMVDNIFKGKLNENQLDNCNLTFRDINKIKQAFLKVLRGIYHERVEYPLDKLEAKEINNDTDR